MAVTVAPHVSSNPESAATGHFFIDNCPGKEIEHEPISVLCANNNSMESTKTTELPLEILPRQARKAHVLPGIK